MTTVLLTGAGGFAGHHALEHILDTTTWNVICTDSFRHKGRTDRIDQVLEGQFDGVDWKALEGCSIAFPPLWPERVKVITHDLTAPFTSLQVSRLGAVDYMICYASESHVDRSIADPVPFILNNTLVALNTLELARKLKPKAVAWISTDEVYGPVAADDLTGFAEWAAILPSNPYSASKASQEAIAFSYWRTYGVPVVIVNCMNMIGERQDPEKFVPLVISKVMKGEEVTIHGSPGNIGTRHYLHSRNLADGILHVLKNRTPSAFGVLDGRGLFQMEMPDRPDRYNIATPDRIDNLTLAHMIADAAGKPLRYKLEDFHSTRPGHDPHYGLDSSRITGMGWSSPVPFDESLRRTVEWTMRHPEWTLPD